MRSTIGADGLRLASGFHVNQRLPSAAAVRAVGRPYLTPTPRTATTCLAAGAGRGGAGSSSRSRGSYSDVTPFAAGPELNKAINKELLDCKCVEDLGTVFSSEGSQFDVINVATAWQQLGKLRAGGAPPPVTDALGRKMMGKTLAVVTCMGLRVISSTLWGMGKAKFNLQADPLGGYFAEAVEQQLHGLILGDDWRNGGLTDSMIWYALSNVAYPWDKAMISALLEASMQGIDDWEDPKAVSQVLIAMGIVGVTLSVSQEEKLVQVVARAAASASAPDGPTEVFYRSMNFILTGAQELKLQLPQVTLRQLHDVALQMPYTPALWLRRLNYAGILFHLTCQGFQPTAQQAGVWADRLLGGFGDKWTSTDIAWTMHALSSIKGYKPPPEYVRRLRFEMAAHRWTNRNDSRRVVFAVNAWGLSLTPAEVGALQFSK